MIDFILNNRWALLALAIGVYSTLHHAAPQPDNGENNCVYEFNCQ